MKLLLKSKQHYGTHIDEINEEFECKVENTLSESNEEVIKIYFENGFIQIEENRVIHERGENKLIIEKDNTYEVDYDTANGMIVLDLKGMEINKTNNTTGLIGYAKYEIQIKGIEPYVNEIEIYLQ